MQVTAIKIIPQVFVYMENYLDTRYAGTFTQGDDIGYYALIDVVHGKLMIGEITQDMFSGEDYFKILGSPNTGNTSPVNILYGQIFDGLNYLGNPLSENAYALNSRWFKYSAADIVTPATMRDVVCPRPSGYFEHQRIPLFIRFKVAVTYVNNDITNTAYFPSSGYYHTVLSSDKPQRINPAVSDKNYTVSDMTVFDGNFDEIIPVDDTYTSSTPDVYIAGLASVLGGQDIESVNHITPFIFAQQYLDNMPLGQIPPAIKEAIVAKWGQDYTHTWKQIIIDESKASDAITDMCYDIKTSWIRHCVTRVESFNDNQWFHLWCQETGTIGAIAMSNANGVDVKVLMKIEVPDTSAFISGNQNEVILNSSCPDKYVNIYVDGTLTDPIISANLKNIKYKTGSGSWQSIDDEIGYQAWTGGDNIVDSGTRLLLNNFNIAGFLSNIESPLLPQNIYGMQFDVTATVSGSVGGNPVAFESNSARVNLNVDKHIDIQSAHVAAPTGGIWSKSRVTILEKLPYSTSSPLLSSLYVKENSMYLVYGDYSVFNAGNIRKSLSELTRSTSGQDLSYAGDIFAPSSILIPSGAAKLYLTIIDEYDYEIEIYVDVTVAATGSGISISTLPDGSEPDGTSEFTVSS